MGKRWMTQVCQAIFTTANKQHFASRDRQTLTADFQIRRLFVLSNGTPRCAKVLTSVGELDILQCERGHPGITPHHYSSIQTLYESRQHVLKKNNQKTVAHFSIFLLHIFINREHLLIKMWPENLPLLRKTHNALMNKRWNTPWCCGTIRTQLTVQRDSINNWCQKAPKTIQELFTWRLSNLRNMLMCDIRALT